MNNEPSKPKKYTLYLTDRSMSVLRGDEGLSARMNAVLDRYLFTVSAAGAPLRALFTDDEWRALLDAYDRKPDDIVLADEIFRWWSHGSHGICGDALWRAAKLPPDEFVVLLELLETELMTGVALTPAP